VSMTTTAPAAQRATARTYAGLFMVTLATLMYEIGLTRIFSVTMWYHFAFVAISVALFGMTVGALLVHLLPQRFPAERVKRQLWLFSVLFALSLAVCFAVQLSFPFLPRATFRGVVSVVATCVVISIPFTFSGIVVCLALTRFPQRVNRLYAADLVGAALGCVLLIALFSRFDGPSLIVLVAALAGVGGLIFALDDSSRPGLTFGGIAVAVLVLFAFFNDSR
jgi:MFS family permease